MADGGERPMIGDIVVYRSRDGIDMPAIITGLAPDEGAHLELFPPPGVGKDLLDYEWGVLQTAGPRPGCWHTRPVG